MSKTRNQSAMSLVFGRNDGVSKSWSDLWDEEFEEEEEQAKQLQTLKEMNSRTWSHESTAAPSLAADNDDTPRQGLSPATKTATLVNDENKIPSIDGMFDHADEDSDMDGLFLYEAPPAKEEPQPQLPRNSASSRRNDMDKWAALGERRRAHGSSPPRKVVNVSLRTGRLVEPALPASSPIKGHAAFDMHHDSHQPFSPVSGNHSPQHNNHQHHHGKRSNTRDRPKECPRHKGRDRVWNWNFDWRKEKRTGFGYLEWVGNWQATRS